MIFSDLFKLNDWDIRKFNILIVSLLAAYDFSFISNVPLYSIKILSQVLGFIILTFIPGYILLRIFKIHNIDRVSNFLLAIGLSLSFIMIFGLFVNIFFPYIGISKPISTFPLFYAINIAILTITIICYFIDKEFSSSKEQLCIKLSPALFCLILLPIFSIIGTYSMNNYNFNMPIMILLFIISLFPILVVLNMIPKNLYPFMIFSISISVLYNLNLISNHLWSFDIFYEAYSSHYVLQNGIWTLNLKFTLPLLLFTILSPIYSFLCDLNVVWVFKIIFPLLFSFTPLALYQIYKKLDYGDCTLDPEFAILSVFIFVFFYGFFKSLPDKQQIAELFLMLIVMLNFMNIDTQKRIILIIFSFSLITSHYGVSCLFMLSLLFIFITAKFNSNKNKMFFSSNYIIFFFILALSWYIYVSGGYIFSDIINVGHFFVSSLSELFQSYNNRSGVYYALYKPKGTIWNIYKAIHIFLQFFIFIGFLNLTRSILNKKTKSFEISAFSFFLYVLLFVQIFKNYGMGFDRIFQITLTLLSPLALWGFISIIIFLSNIYSVLTSSKDNKIDIENKKAIQQKAKLFFAIFLTIFFLLNSGFLFQVARNPLPSYCININTSAGWPVYSDGEVLNVKWLKYHINENNRIAVFNQWSSAVKSRDGLLVAEYFYSKDLIPIQKNTMKLYNTYIFLGKYSTYKIEDGNNYINLKDTFFYKHTLCKSYKIYDSGKSFLYFS